MKGLADEASTSSPPESPSEGSSDSLCNVCAVRLEVEFGLISYISLQSTVYVCVRLIGLMI